MRQADIVAAKSKSILQKKLNLELQNLDIKKNIGDIHITDIRQYII